MANDTMTPNTDLSHGQERLSASGNAKLAFQDDGNLVLYVKRKGVKPSRDGDAAWVARWASNTAGKPATRCSMQGDGNLVLYNAQNKPLWASNTWKHPNSQLVVQDDENMVIYQGTHAIWSTNTWVGASVRTPFNTKTHGFHFLNNFPDGHWSLGVIKFGTRGLCGGMSFTALDHYFAKKPVPARRDVPSADHDPLGKYINARQQESVESNLGHWAPMIMNPDDHALNFWSTHDEWNKLKKRVDAATPVPIGLGVYMNGGASHQVVAIGYQEGAKERWIWTYDPDSPDQEGYVYLSPGRLHWVDEIKAVTPNWPDWRGFFVADYHPKNPPAG